MAIEGELKGLAFTCQIPLNQSNEFGRFETVFWGGSPRYDGALQNGTPKKSRVQRLDFWHSIFRWSHHIGLIEYGLFTEL